MFMPRNLRLRNRILLAFLLTATIAQSSVPLQNPKVRQVGELLRCQCGCNYSVSSCQMQNCHFADPAREKLLTMVEAGMSEEQILASFEKEYGKVILQRPPVEGFYLVGWIMPFAGLALGGALVAFIIMRYLKRRPVPLAATGTGALNGDVSDDPELRKYRDQIEKELADLER